MEENIKDSESSQDNITENKTKANSSANASPAVGHNNTNNTNNTKSNETKSKFSGFSGIKDTIKGVYENDYKKLLIIPIALLLIALVSIGFKLATTGEFINRDVSLKGGVTITIPTHEQIDILQLKNTLSPQFPKNDVSTKALSQFGTQAGIIVEADIAEDQVNTLIGSISKAFNKELTNGDYSVEIVGSSLGASFFKETITALLFAFICMAIVVFLYFRILIPSATIVLCAFADVAVTLAIVNFLGIKIGTAGIAAFLMLIGYSVDTDILLTTKVLKKKEGNEMEKVYAAIKTGMMMTLTTMGAVTIGLIFTKSEVIGQIMTIILIGMFMDMLYTWIQNVAILRWYLERKAKKMHQTQ